MRNVIECVVTDIGRKQAGYGDDARTVGVDVKLTYTFQDEETDDKVNGITTISMPWSARKSIVLGDEMAIVFASRGEV